MTTQLYLLRIIDYRFYLLFTIFLTSWGITFSQPTPSHFVVVEYMKVTPENNVDYLKVEQELWKPMHTERIKRGIIVGWYLYAVQFAGSGNEYNYVVINVYDSPDRLENPWEADIVRTIHPNLSIEQIIERTRLSRQTVKSELHYSVVTAPDVPLDKPAPYMQANFMKVDPRLQPEYEKLESEIWLPIHKQSIELGRTTGFGLWKKLFPRGSGQEYQYMTLNTFSDFSTILGLDFSVPFKEIHPGKDYVEFLEKAQNTRAVMRTELWDLIDYVIR